MEYFIDKEDTNKEPKAIDLGFLHYMAAGMSISDIHRMPKEDLIKVGNEYLEKEKSAIKAFEKLLKKYSHMKENIKPENRVSLSDLLEGGCSVCGNGPCTNESGCNSHKNEDYNQAEEFEPKHLMDLTPGEEFTFNGKKYTFIKMAGGDEITAHVEDSTGFELVVSFGGGMVNTGETSGTSMADMGQGKGHHIDEEEEDRDEELIAKLTPVRQYIDEGYYETSDLENTIITLGYDGFEEFFNDNQGAVDAVDEWIDSVKAFREVLGREDDSDIYEEEDVKDGEETDYAKRRKEQEDYYEDPDYYKEEYDADAEQDDEDVPNPVDDDGKPLEEDRSSARAKLDNARIAFKKDPSEKNRNALSKARDYLVKIMGTDKPLSEEENSLNEAPNFDIIDKCLADYRKWARKQPADSDELYDTTQAFIKTLERLL